MATELDASLREALRSAAGLAAHLAFWDAVNGYATACGGDTSCTTAGAVRESAVVAVEDAVCEYARAALAASEGERGAAPYLLTDEDPDPEALAQAIAEAGPVPVPEAAAEPEAGERALDDSYPTIHRHAAGGYVWTDCVECGLVDVAVDEDGCCTTCGVDALHYGREPAAAPQAVDGQSEARRLLRRCVEEYGPRMGAELEAEVLGFLDGGGAEGVADPSEAGE